MDLIRKIRERAKSTNKTIVLAEGVDERVVRAAAIIREEKLVNVVLLGNENKIKEVAADVDLSGVEIIDPVASPKAEEYAALLYNLRKEKGMTEEKARELVKDPIWYGTLMVKAGDADGMVAGAITATADVFRPAFQIVKTAPGVSVVSSAFMMVVPNCEYGANGVILFADCAINPNPNAQQLAEIAIASSRTWKALMDEEPYIAMLSFSTRGSAQHELVEKVTEATRIVREKAPELKVDGEIQADAALVPKVAKTKARDSQVAGRANILIFPDLNAGNIGYKLVQRLAKAEAVGPISQGLAMPINDLSRGCSTEDIVNVAAITALQASSMNL
ncbi:phosphate acetyltransferase [Thermosediminibacter oceani]|uniref:Phosphate acetyltransferase n=1 Tax=Thermosediminibacter oceani (strain ATCC BAA-1034 / DSM 16646 / JW/IW-1228P) TaxID=555079 RepID=D9S332_THEOJ|nr:phosphate acetyltransferase [Thermosediminibacter oceani]ADL07809.1 phosphotransacetylase [Thermosediminibacter oceani DSM 16646]